MTEFDIETVRDLIGQPVPGGAVPAIWWLTTDPEQLVAYARWKADYQKHFAKVEKLAQTLGLRATDAFVFSYANRSALSGFRVKSAWAYWPGREGYQPMPTGWRIDKKNDRLVPSRKTKADRESQANKDFAAIRVVPNVRAYITGLPAEIYLDDRDFGGTAYPVHYRRGEKCVWAYCGGDPDRQPEKKMNDAVDESIWHRQKLSVLIALREEVTQMS